MERELDLEVRDALLERKGDWQQISESADVSHSWMSQFVRGKIPNPGIETLRKIKKAIGESQLMKAPELRAPAPEPSEATP